MAGNQQGWYQGPRWTEGTLIGSDDLRVSEAPGHFEMVTIHEDTRDQSAAALALNASGYKLTPGLVIYRSETGYFSSVGHTAGNSPAISHLFSPAGDTHEQPFGILLHLVDVYDIETGSTTKRLAAVSRGGHHIDWSKIHDRYGNNANMLPYFTRPDNPKWFRGKRFLFDQTYVSAGAATP